MTALLAVLTVLGALFVLMAAFLLRAVAGLRSEVKGLERKIGGLQADLDRQQQNLDAVRAVLERKSDDPFTGVLDAVRKYRTRGLGAAVALVGLRLFRSYWDGRARKKALPSLDKRAE